MTSLPRTVQDPDADRAWLDRTLAEVRDLNRFDHPAALERAIPALRLARRLGDPLSLARALLAAGGAQARLGRLRVAERAARRAMRLLTEATSASDRACAHTLLGFIHSQRGETGTAFEQVLQARELLVGADEPAQEVQALGNLGLLANDLCDHALALDYQLTALEVLDASGPLDGPPQVAAADERARVLVNMCNTFQELERPADQLSTAGEAVALSRAGGALHILVTALVNRSAARLAAGDLPGALADAQEALELGERIGRHAEAADTRYACGRVWRAMGESAQARTAFDQALATARLRGDFQNEVRLLGATGQLHLDTGDLDLARPLLLASLARARSRQFSKHEAETLNLLSRLEEQAGQFEAALKYAHAHHALERRIFGREQANRIQARLIVHNTQRTRQEAEQTRQHNLKLSEMNAELARQARTDRLTGLANRLAWMETAGRTHAGALRHGGTLAVAMLDIDHFKRVNDQHGHATGDAVLREVARLMQGAARRADLLARFGGEEFALLMPDTDAQGAWLAVERLRAAVAAFDWAGVAPGLSVTMSGGLCHWQAGLSLDRMLAQADAALYGAKGSGRNQVHIAGEDSPA